MKNFYRKVEKVEKEYMKAPVFPPFFDCELSVRFDSALRFFFPMAGVVLRGRQEAKNYGGDDRAILDPKTGFE
ncbi:MAG: hypothetical protein LBL20_07620 [Treponema sp.]|jgi:hypothetical protein|nr:hypothetical protein [Treponema sp.]